MSELGCKTLELLAETKGGFTSAVKNIFNTKTMATLKISELSVGDWVKASGVAKRVHSIEYQNGAYFVNFSDPDTNSEDYIHAPFIEPIPITAEILEKNGFVTNGGAYKWSNKKHRVFVGLKGFPHSVDIEEMDEQFVTKSSRIEVSQLYAHQLQHALRLAWVDKEINL